MDKENINRKYERTTQEQLQLFIGFCREHPEFQSGKCNPSNPQLMKNLWAEVAENLNSLRGPSRTSSKWKETLGHWKHLRSRARKYKSTIKMTGGSPLVRDITEFEQQAIETFGGAAVDGLPGVGTLGHEGFSRSEVIINEDIPSVLTANPDAVTSTAASDDTSKSSSAPIPTAFSPGSSTYAIANTF